MNQPAPKPTPVGVANELYTWETLLTLLGATSAVMVVCAGLEYAFSVNPKWLGLLVAEIITIAGVFQMQNKAARRKAGVWIIAVINGFLIYTQAAGINSMNHGLSAGPAQPTAQSSLVPIGRPWWPDADLARAADDMSRASEKTLAQLSLVIEQLQDPVRSATSRTKDLRSRIESLERDVVQLKAAIPAAHPNEVEALKAKLASTEESLAASKRRKLDLDKALAQWSELKAFADEELGRSVDSLQSAQSQLSAARSTLDERLRKLHPR